MSKTLKNIMLASMIIGIILLLVFEFIWLSNFPGIVKGIVPSVLLVLSIAFLCNLTYNVAFIEGFLTHKTNIRNFILQLKEQNITEDDVTYSDLEIEEVLKIVYSHGCTDTIDAVLEVDDDIWKHFFNDCKIEEET